MCSRSRAPHAFGFGRAGGSESLVQLSARRGVFGSLAFLLTMLPNNLKCVRAYAHRLRAKASRASRLKYRLIPAVREPKL